MKRALGRSGDAEAAAAALLLDELLDDRLRRRTLTAAAETLVPRMESKLPACKGKVPGSLDIGLVAIGQPSEKVATVDSDGSPKHGRLSEMIRVAAFWRQNGSAVEVLRVNWDESYNDPAGGRPAGDPCLVKGALGPAGAETTAAALVRERT